MDSQITVVLPVHNAERTLRDSAFQILELVEANALRLKLLVVDDGSTDGTFETACELAKQFPQIGVLRQPFQGGIGPALDHVRRRFTVNEVIVHDGVGPVNVDELLDLIEQPGDHQLSAPECRGSRRLSGAARNSRWASSHGAVASFHWLRFQEPLVPRRKAGSFVRTEAADALAASGLS